MKALVFCAGSNVRFGGCKFHVKFPTRIGQCISEKTCLQRHYYLLNEAGVEDVVFVVPKEQERIDGILKDFDGKPQIFSVDSNHERVLVDIQKTEALWTDTMLFILGDVVMSFPCYKFIVNDPAEIRVYGSVLHKTNWVHRRERWMIKVRQDCLEQFKVMLDKTVEAGGRGFGCLVREFQLPIVEVSAAGDLDYREDIGLIQEKLQPSDARWNY